LGVLLDGFGETPSFSIAVFTTLESILDINLVFSVAESFSQTITKHSLVFFGGECVHIESCGTSLLVHVICIATKKKRVRYIYLYHVW